jgi:hypothetical protein
MFARSSAAVFAVALVACKPSLEEACEDYVAAWEGCAQEAFAEDPDRLEAVAGDLEGTCAVYEDLEGDAADQAAETLSCFTDALEGGDCGDAESYAGTLLDVAACNPTFPF